MENKDKKNILVLGGFGFIGSNLVKQFLKSSLYNIIIFDLPATQKDWIDLDNVTAYYGDFNNEREIERIFKTEKIDIVIHLISMTIPAVNNFIYDINGNLVNSVKLLELMVKYTPAAKIVFFSSGGVVYGISDKKKIPEDEQTNPICSYGVIKLSIEKYIQLYNHLYGLDYLIIRPSNPFGKYHQSEKQGLINVLLKKIVLNDTIKVWGDGSVVRDYIFIEDLVQVVQILLEKEIKNDIINIGSGIGYSINDILAIMRNEFGEFKIEYTDKNRKFDIPRLILDNSKMLSLSGINLTDIVSSMRETYTWYKKELLP